MQDRVPLIISPGNTLRRIAQELDAGKLRSFVILTVGDDAKTQGSTYVCSQHYENDFVALGNSALEYAEIAHHSAGQPRKEKTPDKQANLFEVR